MKKVVLAGIFVFGSSLLEVHAMSGNHQETQDVSRNVSAGMQSVQAEDGGELVVQSVQTSDAEELTVADLKLNEFREEFKTLMYSCISAFYGEQAKEDPKFKLLATVLDDKHKSQMRTLAMLAQSEKNRQKDTFDRQMEAKDAQLEEVRNEKIRVEKVNTLRGILLKIPVVDKTPISMRAANMLQLDVIERNKRADEFYKRFVPYSELFGRTDLDVVATPDDLGCLNNYINGTKVRQLEPVIPSFQEKGGANWWGEPNVDWGEYNRVVSLVPEARQPYVYENYGRASFGEGWPGHGTKWKDWAARSRFISTGNAGIARINQGRRDTYNAEIARSSSVPFPAEEFNRLVDQVNKFFTEGLQDSH